LIDIVRSFRRAPISPLYMMKARFLRREPAGTRLLASKWRENRY
jgi:hypothetical protein